MTTLTIEDEMIEPAVLMNQLGYKDRASFWYFVRSQGVPYIQLTARKFVFPKLSVEAWLESRKRGMVPAHS